MRSGNPLQATVGLGKDSETQQVFDDIHASLRGDEAQLHPPMAYQYPASFEPVANETVPEAAPDAAPTPEPAAPKAAS